MKIYLVGGAVRDHLIQQFFSSDFANRKYLQSHSDRDWVVVGSTPEEMTQKGFKPVGQDFPVFLHPDSKEEYALARTDKKTGKGYKGFTVYASPEITLEEDLKRRDLTINAMAVDLNNQTLEEIDIQSSLIDPYGGQQDLLNKTFKHVSEAFIEDPLRLIRVARFSARWPDFKIHEETLKLMKTMVADGELQVLSAERIWLEIAKGLNEVRPSKMFQVLDECGALKVLLPEIYQLFGVPQSSEHHPEIDTGIHALMCVDVARELNYSLAVKWASLVHDVGKALTPKDEWPRHKQHDQRGVEIIKKISERLRLPHEVAELSILACREHIPITQAKTFGAEGLLRLLERCDAFRKPDRFFELLRVCECDQKGRWSLNGKLNYNGLTLEHKQKVFDNKNEQMTQINKLAELLKYLLQLDLKSNTTEWIAQGFTGVQIGKQIEKYRLEKIKEFVKY